MAHTVRGRQSNGTSKREGNRSLVVLVGSGLSGLWINKADNAFSQANVSGRSPCSEIMLLENSYKISVVAEMRK